MPTYQLSANALTAVRNAIQIEDWPAGYRAIRDDLNAQNAAALAAGKALPIDSDTLAWYTNAAEINSSTSTSFIHYFVRNYVSEYARLTLGQRIEDPVFQSVSDDLARQVLQTVDTTNGTLLGFALVGIIDTRNSISGFSELGIPVDKYAWPAYAELAAGFAPTFKNHSYLQGIPVAKELAILATTTLAFKQAFFSAPISSETGSQLFSDYLNGLYLAVDAPYVLAKFELQQIGSPGNLALKLSRSDGLSGSITVTQDSVQGLYLTQDGIGIGLESVNGLSRTISFSGGGSSVSIGGGSSLNLGATSIFNVNGGNIAATSTSGSWQLSSNLSAFTPSTTAALSDGSLVLSTSAAGASGSFNGSSFVGATGLGNLLSSHNSQQQSSSNTSTGSLLSIDAQNIISGNINALPSDIGTLVATSAVYGTDKTASELVAQRLAYGYISDHWISYYLDKNLTSQLVTQQIANSLTNSLANSFRLPTLSRIPNVSTWEEGVGHVLSNPLVLDLDGHGISLTREDQSAARFDGFASGAKQTIGWVGPTNGILVLDKNQDGIINDASEWFGQYFSANGSAPPANQTGFQALAQLATPGAATFSEATSLINPSTQISYFDEIQVWVNPEGDGVTHPGELHSLTSLGITSVDLTSTIVNRGVGGNEVLASAGFTFSDGTRQAIDDIGLSVDPPSLASLQPNLSDAALAFDQLVSLGLPGQAAGTAQAAASDLANQTADFSTDLNKISSYQIQRNSVSGGYAFGLSWVSDPTPIWLFYPPVPNNFNSTTTRD
jgi:hypothetical protein